MADQELTNMTAASTLDGTEVTYAVQADADRKATVAQIRAASLPLAGGAMTGDIVLAGAPSAANHPATKTYVDTALTTKAASVHTHVTGDVSGLDAALAGKAATGHTHAAANVTDFAEAVDDRVAALLVEGTGITLTYDDTAGTITVDAAGGGGGYPKLTASGANGGIFTFFDDTALTGETRVAIREGADLSGFENLFEIQNNAGTPQWYIGGVNNDFRTYMPTSGLVDANERYFRISSGGIKAPSDGAIGFTDGTNVYAAYDAYFGRSAAGVVDVLTTAAALAKLRCANLAVLGGDVSLGPADSGGAGFSYLRIPNP